MSALRLELAPSPAFAAAILVAHAVAGACACAVVPGAAGVLLAAALFALGAAAAWSRALLRSASSVRAVEISGEALVVENASGTRSAPSTVGRCHVSRYLVTFALRNAPLGRRTVIVTRDMLDEDLFRALRTWALWGRLPARRPTPSVAAKPLRA